MPSEIFSIAVAPANYVFQADQNLGYSEESSIPVTTGKVATVNIGVSPY